MPIQKMARSFESTSSQLTKLDKETVHPAVCPRYGFIYRESTRAVVALSLVLMCSGVQARPGMNIGSNVGSGAGLVEDSYEYARVLNSVPLPGAQVARQICQPVTVMQQQPVASSSSGNVVGAIAGGVLGAVVGSRFGGGHGRDAATVVGAIGGTMIGHGIGNDAPVNTRMVTTTQQNCQTVYEPGPPAGYRVTYDYQGRLYTSVLATPPGAQLRLRKRITVE